MQRHKWMYIYVRSACASVYLYVWQVFTLMVPWMCACINWHLWACICLCVCMCVFQCVHVCVRWEGPWSSALCSQRIAWLPSLYEPWVQSDRNKKPYSALGIRKTGFGLKEQGHTHTHADTHKHTQAFTWRMTSSKRMPHSEGKNKATSVGQVY